MKGPYYEGSGSDTNEQVDECNKKRLEKYLECKKKEREIYEDQV